MFLPDRLTPLIQRLEAGQTVTQEEVDRLALLQVLDLAKAGEEFVRANIALNEQMIALMEKDVP